MPISQQGALNTAALAVPNVYIQIVPPQFLVNGIPTNILGIVGTAEWGPVNRPITIGDTGQFGAVFGGPQPRTHDLGTALWIAKQQGAHAFKCVRVTDGTDVAATILVQTNCITFTSKYTGKRGNRTKVFVDPGSLVSSFKVRVAMPGVVAELFDNIGKGVASVGSITGGSGYTTAPLVTFQEPPGTWIGGRVAKGTATVDAGAVTAVTITDAGNYPPGFTPTVAFGGPGTLAAGTTAMSAWPAIAEAINSGLPNARGPSELIIATAGVGVTAPATASYDLAGGTDGSAGVSGTQLLGVDTLPRTGMYALRSQDVSVAMLADLTDTSTWANQNSFGLAEGIEMILVGPSGQSISAAISAKSSAALDSFASKVMLGDWCTWNDTVNGLSNRLVSPQAFVAGRMANLSPHQSVLNKPIEGLVSTQKSLTGLPYTDAEIQDLVGASIDVICTPAPGGRYFACRTGHNASSNAAVHGDNYTRMTNFIAATLNRGMGIYIGQPQAGDLRRRAKATLDAFLFALQQQGMIGNPNGQGDAFQVVLDDSNNPFNRVALGYMQADVKVTYLSIVEFFIINLEGGQTVQVTRGVTQQATFQAAA